MRKPSLQHFGHISVSLLMISWKAEGLAAKENMELFPHHMPFGAYIANCVGTGDLTEARKAASEFLAFDPNFRVSRSPEIFPVRLPQMHQKLDNAFRTAGLPE